MPQAQTLMATAKSEAGAEVYQTTGVIKKDVRGTWKDINVTEKYARRTRKKKTEQYARRLMK